MPTVERTTKAIRIIVRQEGVGLSMLRNLQNDCIKNKYERSNQHCSLFFRYCTLQKLSTLSLFPLLINNPQ